MFGRKKPTCETCGVPAGDVLAIGKNSPLLCREHLLERFEAAFTSFEHPFVVCEPHFTKYSDTMYPFYPLAHFKKYEFDKKATATVGAWIDSIAGTCRQCEESARTLYFPAGATTYSNDGQEFARFDRAGAALYCQHHAFDILRPLLANNPKSYDEGLVPPHEGPGIFVSTFL